MPVPRSIRGLRMERLGRILLVCGLSLLSVYLIARMHALVGTSVALAQLRSGSPSDGGITSSSEVDTTEWSETRIKAFQETLGLTFEPPVAELRIPATGLVVPVLPGTDDVSLNRGVGWIAGTARPDAGGNVGVAGHRDGFFRVLKDVGVGDVIELETAEGVREYVIEWTRIVEPKETSVLMPTGGPALTLVTCYPFYFVGSAPQRFVVRATPRATPSVAGSTARN